MRKSQNFWYPDMMALRLEAGILLTANGSSGGTFGIGPAPIVKV
jgi:hypothetical protein